MAENWKVGNEFLPFHPRASHVPPDYRDGWNACYRAAVKPDLARAADFLEQYASFIRREVMSVDIEAHPYLPELEQVAADLRVSSLSQEETGSDEKGESNASR